MDVILNFVQELLEYLREFEAAGIIGIIKDSGVLEALKGIFDFIPMPW